jgi:spore coat polysaccharide biosynthesis protein SpsF
VLAVLQARMSSTRLPGKVMRPLLGEPMIARQVERLRRSRAITRLLVATSEEASDDPLAAFLPTIGVEVVRGPLHDVLARFVVALDAAGAPEHLLRLTADCPLADPEVIDLCVARHREAGVDYTANTFGRTFPVGLDVEVVRSASLRAAAAEATDPYEREHVTPFVYRRPERFRIAEVRRDPPERWRWTVDTPEDFAFVEAVYAHLHPADPAFASEAVLAWQRAHPGRAIPAPPPV